MKPKKFSRKLSLNKKTISHLNGKEMRYFHGGAPSVPPYCVHELTVTEVCCPSYHPPGESEAPIFCQCIYKDV